MASEKPQPSMVDDQYRGLLTDREREILRGDADVSENYRYRVVSRVRTKLEALEDDAELLETHRPDLHDELSDAVCDPGRTESDPSPLDIQAIRGKLDDLEAALERGDRATIQERMAELRESIDDA